MHHLKLIYLLLTWFSIDVSDATLSVSPVIACPGDTVRVTCDTAPTSVIRWIISYQGGPDLERPVLISQIGMTLTVIDDPGFGFQITAAGSGSSITSSVLTFPANATLNGGTVECAAPEIDTITLQIQSSPPDTPSDVTPSPNVQFTRDGALVVINWTPVVSADNYTVEVNPSIDSGSGVITTTSTVLSVSYNISYTVTVSASNCIGNSGTTTTTVRIAGCNPLPPLANGLINDYPNGSVGAVLSFQCNEDYLPTSDPAMATCQESGSWSPIPACREISCGPPSPATGVTIETYPSTMEGSVIFFQCEEGLIPEEREMAVCGSDERWDPDPANHRCGNRSSVDCGDPQPPVNGIINSYSSTIEGAQITFQCNDDPVNVMTSVCSSTGVWEPDPAMTVCQTTTTTTTATTTANPSSQPSGGGLGGGAIGGIVAGLLVLALVIGVVVLIIVLYIKRRGLNKGESHIHVEMQSTGHGGASDPEGTLNGEYSKLQHPEGYGYSVLKHPGPHGNKSSGNVPDGLVYADVGNFDKSKKRAFEMSTVSELDDNRVQYSALTHKPPPPPEVAAIDKLLNLDSLAIQLKEVSSIWYELGEQLGIPREMLNDIESHYNNVEDRRIEMFDVYLRMEPHPTWSQVAKALRRLHENTLAEKLENSYVTGQLPIQINMDVVPSSSYKHSKGPPPPLPPKSSDFDFDDSVDVSSPAPLILPPKPPKQGDTSLTSWKRPPPPVPQFDDGEPTAMVPPPRPPKSGEPAQPPRPPKPKNL